MEMKEDCYHNTDRHCNKLNRAVDKNYIYYGKRFWKITAVTSIEIWCNNKHHKIDILRNWCAINEFCVINRLIKRQCELDMFVFGQKLDVMLLSQFTSKN